MFILLNKKKQGYYSNISGFSKTLKKLINHVNDNNNLNRVVQDDAINRVAQYDNLNIEKGNKRLSQDDLITEKGKKP